METKEAIERIENVYSVIESANWVGREEKGVLESEKKKIIELLHRGEENRLYKLMWKEFKHKRGDIYMLVFPLYLIQNKGTIRDDMNDFERRYKAKILTKKQGG